MKLMHLIVSYILGICVLVPLIALILAFLLAILLPIFILAIPAYILQLLITLFCNIFHTTNPYED